MFFLIKLKKNVWSEHNFFVNLWLYQKQMYQNNLRPHNVNICMVHFIWPLFNFSFDHQCTFIWPPETLLFDPLVLIYKLEEEKNIMILKGYISIW